MVMLWHINLRFFQSLRLIFNHHPTPIQFWQPLIPNKLIQLILCLEITILMYNFWYNLYHLLLTHTSVCCVSRNSYIFNMIQLIVQQKCPLANIYQTIYHFHYMNRILTSLKIIYLSLISSTIPVPYLACNNSTPSITKLYFDSLLITLQFCTYYT